MPNEATIIAAFFAGMLSFLTPCVLPLVPAYLSLMSGVSATDVREGTADKWRIVTAVSMFILGFTTVFVAFHASASVISRFLVGNQAIVRKIAGVFIFTMGCLMVANAFGKLAWLMRERRFEARTRGLGLWGAPIMGAAFAFAWTPCIGPVLGAVLATAQAEQTAGRGVILLVAYSLGLGVPFMAAGLAMGRLVGFFDWFKRHSKGLQVATGVILAAFGILLFFNLVSAIAIWMQQLFAKLGLDWLSSS
ncbi:MAG: cytochrome C biogenesis protein [Acidobacteria bacterium]|nr:MAG: cytochrome C biogenesis protein [Acidobacteriota bacterium]